MTSDVYHYLQVEPGLTCTMEPNLRTEADSSEVFLLCCKSIFQVSVLYQCFPLENFTSQHSKA